MVVLFFCHSESIYASMSSFIFMVVASKSIKVGFQAWLFFRRWWNKQICTVVSSSRLRAMKYKIDNSLCAYLVPLATFSLHFGYGLVSELVGGVNREPLLLNSSFMFGRTHGSMFRRTLFEYCVWKETLHYVRKDTFQNTNYQNPVKSYWFLGYCQILFNFGWKTATQTY